MEIPYEVTPRRDTGLFNSKIAIWLFLASEVMLFGGLFSAYVFLRVGIHEGIDNPWPERVQEPFLGAVNTVVLIASSVFVVLAWVGLKMRKWRTFQIYMSLVIVCALTFLVVKTREYQTKLVEHHGINLKDGSVIEGEILSDNYKDPLEQRRAGLPAGITSFFGHQNGDSTLKVRFLADSVTLPVDVGSLDFMGFAADGMSWAKATVKDGSNEVTLEGKGQWESWFYKKKREIQAQLAEARKQRRHYVQAEVLGKGRKIDEVLGDKEIPSASQNDKKEAIETKFTFTFAEKVKFLVPGSNRVAKHTDATLTFVDSTELAGTMATDGDVIDVLVHGMDLQRLPISEQMKAKAWTMIVDEKQREAAKKQFKEKQDKVVASILKEYPEGKFPSIEEEKHQLGTRHVSVLPIHLHGDHGHHEEPAPADEAKKESGGAKSDPHASGHGGHGDGELILARIPRSEVQYASNHGPWYNTYYAIYFTMTGLHGLHVLGGAIVLAYMMFFGKKLYLRNPEHLANRVEVGGLFWHFVDLVWIFLFPIMYLM